ncbi:MULTISPECIES: DEAD/DEAH box helicase [Rhodomicrobium]|uniref:DEAD/DEAH box helicase n=1 Tax=Rhodomicrobium TaxID=1068 RepID=UPI000B4A8F98|nr:MULTISPECIES: DEAD/DEAH box helicase [Rhodomicrobium]
MTDFNTLGLNPSLLKALADEGYTVPTPIQTQAIPHVLAGRDLLGIAQTGTGKTAAFALPILHRLAANKRPALRQGARVLILAPTRELANQIAASFRTYGRHMGLTVATMFGGVSHRPQIAATRNGVDVLVATPGRLIDHMDERNITLSGTEILVLDEADQMLDMGFIRPIKQIIRTIPAKRQNLFFSATMTNDTSKLAAEILRDPVEVSVTPRSKTADRVAQRVIHIEAPKKRALLVELFSDPALSRTLVFTRTKRGADKVARHLESFGVAVSAIHGNKSQGQREAALAAFKTGRIRALVATDVAARGIDIDEVTHVVNYELPNLPESYVHRIGRTARAGAEGIAISLCDAEERAYLRDIEKLIRQSIPSTNRCGDTSLVAEEKGASSAADQRGRNGGGRSGGGRSERSGGGYRSERNGEARRSDGAGRGRGAPQAAKARVEGAGGGAARDARPASTDARPGAQRRPEQPSRGRSAGRNAPALSSGSWRPTSGGKKSGGGQRSQPSR